MGLIYWLPMTDGSICNQGLSNSIPIISGESVVAEDSGKLGKCIHVSSGHIEIPVDDIVTFSGSCTIACWLKVVSNSTSYATVFSATSSGYSWGKQIFTFQRSGSTSNYTFNVSTGSSSTQNNCIVDNLPLNEWHHVVCMYDISDKHLEIFIDGVSCANYSTDIVPGYSKIKYLRIGKSYIGY